MLGGFTADTQHWAVDFSFLVTDSALDSLGGFQKHFWAVG